jgi:hypothetical protein
VHRGSMVEQVTPSHICTGTGLTPATSAPGLGSPLPHPRRDWVYAWFRLRRMSCESAVHPTNNAHLPCNAHNAHLSHNVHLSCIPTLCNSGRIFRRKSRASATTSPKGGKW